MRPRTLAVVQHVHILAAGAPPCLSQRPQVLKRVLPINPPCYLDDLRRRPFLVPLVPTVGVREEIADQLTVSPFFFRVYLVFVAALAPMHRPARPLVDGLNIDCRAGRV